MRHKNSSIRVTVGLSQCEKIPSASVEERHARKTPDELKGIYGNIGDDRRALGLWSA